MKITRQQRYEYRDLLIEKGVPEEIAVIASERLDHEESFSGLDAASLIFYGFDWGATPEGFCIWKAVYLDAQQEVCK